MACRKSVNDTVLLHATGSEPHVLDVFAGPMFVSAECLMMTSTTQAAATSLCMR